MLYLRKNCFLYHNKAAYDTKASFLDYIYLALFKALQWTHTLCGMGS